jgi:hypothetical protein
MTNLPHGEQFPEREFGADLDLISLAALGILALSAGAFLWFLIKEHENNIWRNHEIVSFHRKLYDRTVLAEMEQRYNDGA